MKEAQLTDFGLVIIYYHISTTNISQFKKKNHHHQSLIYPFTGDCGQIVMHNLNSPPYGRSSRIPRMPSLNETCERNERDFMFHIHQLEKEAYCSVLRAFVAQSDHLSWGKEGLLTELRKELNVTDIEHSQLLLEINSDESTKRIREWRKGAYESVSAKANNPLVTNLVDNAASKVQWVSSSHLSKSRKHASCGQPCSAIISSLPQEHLSDNQQHGEMELLSSSMSLKMTNFQGSLSNKFGGPSQSVLKNNFHTSNPGKLKNTSEFIQIRSTDMVINEVNRMAYGRDNLDPWQVEKHERDILQALEKLSNVSDEDVPGLPYSYQQLHGNRHKMLASTDFHGQVGRIHNYLF